VQLVRVVDAPLVQANLLPGDDGGDISGPSLMRFQALVKNSLVKYYLYVALRAGKYPAWPTPTT